MQPLRKTVVTWVSRAILAGGLVCLATASLPAAEEGDELDKQIAQLIEQLGDKDYFVRQKAQAQLAKLGFEAFDALAAAEEHEDLEVATRVKYLLRLMRTQWTTEDDPPEVQRYLEDYESLRPGDRIQRMRSLAGLADGAGTIGLCRLVRFEKSMVLSKRAAAEILDRQPPDQPPTDQLADALRQGLGRSRRTPATWLRTYLRFGDDPQQAMAEWNKLVEEELSVLGRSPNQSDPAIAAALVRLQVKWLAGLDRKQDAVAAMWKLIDLEKGDPESLSGLVDWLVQQKQWEAIGKVAQRFADRFQQDPILLYTLAQAQAALGNDPAAAASAAKALALNSGTQLDDIVAHLMTAFALRRRGLFPWAEQEYRYVIRSAVTGQNLTATARFGLSEMLHDQGDDQGAAEILQPLVDAIAKMTQEPEELAGRPPAAIRSRMNHFYARHWGEKGDRQKQRKYLEAAVAADPTDCDVLISCYRLPGADAAWHANTVNLIEKAADVLRERIASEPEEAIHYNQFAWLIGNTEGDFEEALKYSKKSLELEPDAGGYYDTMGRVYYGKGDYENAVKTQTKAAEMDPHSGLIRKQLALFREALEKKNQEKPAPPDPPAEKVEPAEKSPKPPVAKDTRDAKPDEP